MKVLVFTTDMPPLGDVPTSGTALRTYGFIQGLRAHGHEVVISVPKRALSGFTKRFKQSNLPEAVKAEVQTLKKLAFNPYNQQDVLHKVDPDVVLCGHWPAMALRTKPSQVLINDHAGPH